jgi:hypothetical protein
MLGAENIAELAMLIPSALKSLSKRARSNRLSEFAA